MEPVTATDLGRPAPHVVIIGGGPGGYEAALVARQLGAEVTIVECSGIGGAAVLTDVVPSKTLIATAELRTIAEGAEELGIFTEGPGDTLAKLQVDLSRVNRRVLELARAQSADIRERLVKDGVRIVAGHGRLIAPDRVAVQRGGAAGDRGAHVCDGGTVGTDGDDASTSEPLAADVVLIATGARPRELPSALPDGERILTWKQLYALDELPEHLIVVGSGVTGAEFAGAYNALGGEVTLVSSREQVLPNEDQDAAALIEQVFQRRGMTVLSKSRAASVKRVGDRVVVELADGRTVEGSHCLMAVGSVPNTSDMGLAEVGIDVSESGHVIIDRVSRTSVRGVYAAGDCTGVLPLASVAAMQGRIAMWHALGEAVAPLDLGKVTANIFTAPEIATVGFGEAAVLDGTIRGRVVVLPLSGNARAKMLGIREGFIKLIAHRISGMVLGGVVVAPRASEFIFPIALAIEHGLTADDVAHAFTVYPSLSGSIAEAARLLHPYGTSER